MKKLTKNIIKKLVLEVLDEATSSSNTTGMPPGWHQAKAERDTAFTKWQQHLDINPGPTKDVEQGYYATPKTSSDLFRGGVSIEPGKNTPTTHDTQKAFRDVVVQGTTSGNANIQKSAQKSLQKLDTEWGTADTPDTTKWTHPYSNVTTTLGKGQTKPKYGWGTTRQTAQTYTHPYTKQKTPVTPKGNIPLLGWEIAQKGAKTTYGQGSQKDYTKAQQTLQKGQQISKAQDIAVDYDKGKSRYNQGELSGWQAVRTSLGKTGVSVSPDRRFRDSALTQARKTTNPTTKTFSSTGPWSYTAGTGRGEPIGQSFRTVTQDNPDFPGWQELENQYKQTFQDKDAAWQAMTPVGGSRESEGPPPPTAGSGAKGKGRGKGRGRKGRGRRGKGRGRGKGKATSYKSKSRAAKRGAKKGSKKGKKGKKGREDEAFRSSILKDIILELKDLEKYNK